MVGVWGGGGLGVVGYGGGVVVVQGWWKVKGWSGSRGWSGSMDDGGLGVVGCGGPEVVGVKGVVGV